jgi:hypothetical protein
MTDRQAVWNSIHSEESWPVTQGGEAMQTCYGFRNLHCPVVSVVVRRVLRDQQQVTKDTTNHEEHNVSAKGVTFS